MMKAGINCHNLLLKGYGLFTLLLVPELWEGIFPTISKLPYSNWLVKIILHRFDPGFDHLPKIISPVRMKPDPAVLIGIDLDLLSS